MRENISQFLKRKLENAEQDLKDAKRVKDRMIEEATLQGDKLVSFHEGKVKVLDDLKDLDWDTYSEIQMVDRK